MALREPCGRGPESVAVKLGEWLKQQQMTQAAFAELIRSDQSHISDLVRGKVKPKLESIVRIQQATGGAVQAQDWLPEAKPPRVRMEKLKAAVRKVVKG